MGVVVMIVYPVDYEERLCFAMEVCHHPDEKFSVLWI